MPPQIEAWSDYMCPFCYAGTAAGRYLQERYDAHLEYRPFDLHPDYPLDGIALDRYPAGLMDRAVAVVREAGLPVTERRDRAPNTFKALRLGELARERGVHAELHHRLFDALWARGLDIGSDGVLVAEAVAAGLEAADARDVLGTDRFADVVRAETERAYDLGVTGVPAWVIDGRALVPGAQDHEVFDRVMTKLGHAPLTNPSPRT